MTRTITIGILLVLLVTLAACSGGEADAPTETIALPLYIQLSVGTLMLEETPQALTAEQAQELLPLWQMLRTLQQSDTTAQIEIEAVLNQIQKAMTPEQLAAIEGMDLTLASMRTMAQELGLGIGTGEGSSGGQEGGFRPPDGMIPGGGPGPGGGMVPGGGMPGGGTDISPEERATAIAERMSSGFGTALMDRLIELLESRAGESEASAVASKARLEATASPSVEANNEAKGVPVQNAEPSPPTGGIVTETLVAETLTLTATSQPSNAPIIQSSDTGAEAPVPPSPTPTPTPSSTARRICNPAGAAEPKLTGKLVFQTSNGGDIYVINADGSGLRRLTDGMEPAWSPDGTKVAFTRWQDPRGLYIIDQDGSNETLVFGWVAAKGAAWSPDGSRIAFTRWYGGRDEDTEVCFHGRCRTLPADHWWKLGVVRLEDGYLHDLRCYPHSLSPTWSPDGSVIAYDSDFGIHLTNEEGTIGDVTDDRSLFALSTDGRDITPVWSPDGTKIAFGFNQHDHWEIYVMNADGSNRVRLTQEEPLAERPPNNVSPAWSPDGQHIAFFTDRNGKW